HAHGGVGDDAALNLAGGLLRPYQDDPEAAAALRDVEQHLLDRAVALRGCVLVELVQDHEQLAALALLLGAEEPLEHHPYNEHLRQWRQLMDVDHVHLSLTTEHIEPGVVVRLAADVPADEVGEMLLGTPQPADQR